MSSPVQHRLARPLRVLVLPLDLGLGGSINAVELAIAVRKRGHDVTVAAPPGPLVDRLQQADTPYVPVTAPPSRKPGSPFAKCGQSPSEAWTSSMRMRLSG